jgi:hypothetical protein
MKWVANGTSQLLVSKTDKVRSKAEVDKNIMDKAGPEIVTPAEDFKVAARTLRHYVDSAGTSGKKEGVIDTVAGLPALRFRHIVFKVCFSQVF